MDSGELRPGAADPGRDLDRRPSVVEPTVRRAGTEDDREVRVPQGVLVGQEAPPLRPFPSKEKVRVAHETLQDLVRPGVGSLAANRCDELPARDRGTGFVVARAHAVKEAVPRIIRREYADDR